MPTSTGPPTTTKTTLKPASTTPKKSAETPVA